MDTPDWFRFLVAADYDPLKAQELEQRLNVPEPYLSVVLAMAKGKPERAVKILNELDAVWFHRWTTAIEAKAKGEELNGSR